MSRTRTSSCAVRWSANGQERTPGVATKKLLSGIDYSSPLASIALTRTSCATMSALISTTMA